MIEFQEDVFITYLTFLLVEFIYYDPKEPPIDEDP